MPNPFRRIDDRRVRISSFRRFRHDVNFNAGDDPPHNADTDLIMEWLVDFVLTHCNFWRGVPRREKRNREERAGRDGSCRIRRTRNADEYVSGMCEGTKEGRTGAPHEEYPSRARNLFVGRPQTVRRYGIVWLQRDGAAAKTWNRYNELTKTEENASLARVAKKKRKFHSHSHRWIGEESFDKFEPFPTCVIRETVVVERVRERRYYEVNPRNRA